MTPKFLPTWSPKMMSTWLYRQDFAKFSLNRHYNSTWRNQVDLKVLKENASTERKSEGKQKREKGKEERFC
ncbi:hypothetical protein TNCV_2563901 [Trichonephila clavipes]|nr:hypothetical protein TNCV_2563901 [Trichonephila clavipes]